MTKLFSLVLLAASFSAVADDFTCKILKPKRFADFVLKVREEGKAHTVSLKSEKATPPEEFQSKGAVKIESTGSKKAKTVIFSGESITLTLDPATKTGSFIGVFRGTEGRKKRKAFSGEIQCD